jgi:hypothetical protein
VKTDPRRYVVIARTRGVVRGSMTVTGANNVPAAKAHLGLTHLGSDDIREFPLGVRLRLVWSAPAATKAASGGGA